MKRIITNNELESIIDTTKWKFERDIRTWKYGYIYDANIMTDDELYAVIIADDNKFEGK